MTNETWAIEPPVTLVRWLARGLSIVVAATVVLFLFGEGPFDPAELTRPEALLMGLFWMSWLGLLVAWRWELLGGTMTVGGIAGFYVAEFMSAGQFPRGWAFAVIALPGILFLWCGLRARVRRVPPG
ncbi:MAG TPA: hypothetical protein VM597_39570 [Gemmataceae bacterium]|nr:hypothetical protein [Gemmataceae bacterium]